VLVVSEETGTISISHGGTITRIHDMSKLAEVITSRISSN
jgi:DNA integrity scanning protein DisA with diadenylate cyclase activity